MPADPAQTHVAQTLKHGSALLSCRFDPTGKFVVAGGQDNKLSRFTLADGARVELTGGHDSWVRAIAFSPTGDTMVTGGYDGRLVWWPIAADQPTPQRPIDAHVSWIRAIAMSPDGQLIATAGNDRKVKVWRFADGSLVKEFSGHERHVYNVVFHPDGKQLLSGDLVGKFFHWSLDADAPVRQFAIASLSKFDAGFMADYGGPHCMTITPDGKRVLAGGITNVTNAFAGVGNPIIVAIDWDAGKDAVTHLTKGKINATAWGVVMHPEGFVIGAVGGQAGGHLYFWKPDQADEFHTLNLGNSARDLALHPDGLRVATAHHDGNVRVSLMAPKPA